MDRNTTVDKTNGNLKWGIDKNTKEKKEFSVKMEMHRPKYQIKRK